MIKEDTKLGIKASSISFTFPVRTYNYFIFEHKVKDVLHYLGFLIGWFHTMTPVYVSTLSARILPPMKIIQCLYHCSHVSQQMKFHTFSRPKKCFTVYYEADTLMRNYCETTYLATYSRSHPLYQMYANPMGT